MSETKKMPGGANMDREMARQREKFSTNEKGDFDGGDRSAYKRVQRYAERMARRELARQKKDSEKGGTVEAAQRPASLNLTSAPPTIESTKSSVGGFPPQSPLGRGLLVDPPNSGEGVVVFTGGQFNFLQAPTGETPYYLGIKNGKFKWTEAEEC